MKKTLLILIILFFGCKSPKNQFSIIGKWKRVQEVVKIGNDYPLKNVENGEVIIFEKHNVAIDEYGNKGTYEIDGENLHILFPKNEIFYFFSPYKNNVELTLVPDMQKYNSNVDKGIGFVYKKIQ